MFQTLATSDVVICMFCFICCNENLAEMFSEINFLTLCPSWQNWSNSCSFLQYTTLTSYASALRYCNLTFCTLQLYFQLNFHAHWLLLYPFVMMTAKMQGNSPKGRTFTSNSVVSTFWTTTRFRSHFE